MIRRIAALLIVLMLLVPSALAQEVQEVCILFTHDMHSHLSPQPEGDGTRGGFARLKTLIDRETEAAGDALVLDAGDFSMGTLYQAVYETDVSELTMMAHLGFDATTIGNHEFDYRGQGMADMLQAAISNAEAEDVDLPAMLVSNIDWTTVSDEDGRTFQSAMEAYGARENLLLTCNGVKVGVFGVMGKDSLACAPLSPVQFTDIVEAAKVQVAELKKQGAELIVCLSHSGLWADPAKSEDELLAKAVPEIDLIISGHTHTTLEKPLVHGSTHIVSCGEYTMNLGRIVLRRDGTRWTASEYELIPTTDDVAGDEALEQKLAEYRERVSQNYLSRFGYTFDQVLTRNPGDLQSEYDLLADAFMEAVKKVEGDTAEPIAMAVVPGGIIRGELPAGDVTTSDAFNILSLGIGPDRIPGYPLVSVYLTGRELYDLAEVDASVSSLMNGTDLHPSGGGWEYKTNRLILSRVYDVWLYDENGEKLAIEEDRLYRVVADLYSGQMLGAVKSSSFGLLSLEPKDKDGKIITDYETCIIRDKNGNEVKAWAALADYLTSFGGEIPARYTEASQRIVQSEADEISEYFAHAGRIWYVIAAVAAALLILILLTVFTTRFVVRKIRRRSR
ncbi:MAG: bifunctional metallophosphatase/5'-nucleotidase [Clostridia bacterium]|nr:bifunctional metallophosphatase/5'-nucleotidase [Clostridia bacterium]